uniref:ATP synthase F0 subunit 8 n=1 Tax=Ikanecator primus TaxID=3115570 RepID=A0AAU7VFK3_9MAXI
MPQMSPMNWILLLSFFSFMALSTFSKIS